MPRLQATVLTTVTEEVQLSPKQRQKLLTKLRRFADLKAQLDAIELKMAEEKLGVTEVLEELGQETLGIEGFKATLVSPVRSKFDKKAFVRFGGDLAIYEKATKKTPGKSYTKITTPGSKDREESED